jgi:hypothetical protein
MIDRMANTVAVLRQFTWLSISVQILNTVLEHMAQEESWEGNSNMGESICSCEALPTFQKVRAAKPSKQIAETLCTYYTE